MTEKLRVLIGREEIAGKVAELAAQISQDYRDSNPLLLGVLKGSFIFLSDLVRALTIPVEIDFVRLASYGAGTETSGKVRVVHGLRRSIRGRHVIVVEDITDTGLTIQHLTGYLKRRHPASVKLCALFDKPQRRRVPVSIDYLGFTLPDAFVVGYGLDFNEKFRHLPELYVLEQEA